MENQTKDREMTDSGDRQGGFEPVGKLRVRQVYAAGNGLRFEDCLRPRVSSRREA